jgi:photosystem II stability/assembly factor-like uncharacterized protein
MKKITSLILVGMMLFGGVIFATVIVSDNVKAAPVGWSLNKTSVDYSNWMMDISMPDYSFATAVGSGGRVLEYYDGVWHIRSSPVAHNLVAVTNSWINCPAWAISYEGDIIYRWWPTDPWTIYSHATSVTKLWDIDMFSALNEANMIYAVGGDGLIFSIASEYDPDIQIVQSPTTVSLTAIDMVSSTFGVIVGAQGTILHYNGGSWSQVTSPTTKTLMDVSMLNTNLGWAVGDDGTILKYNGISWSIVQSGVVNNLNSVCSVNETLAFIGGEDVSLRWLGNSWENMPLYEPEYPVINRGNVRAIASKIWKVNDQGAFLLKGFAAVNSGPCEGIFEIQTLNNAKPTVTSFNIIGGVGSNDVHTLQIDEKFSLNALLHDIDDQYLDVEIDWGDGTNMSINHIRGYTASSLDYCYFIFAVENINHAYNHSGNYNIHLRGFDGYDYGDWSNYSIIKVIGPPSCPINLQVQKQTNGIFLSWQAPTDNGNSIITNYVIWRGTSSLTEERYKVINGSLRSYLDTEYSTGHTYYYQVCALNYLEEGERSNGVNISIETEDSGGIGGFGNLLFNPILWAIIIAVIIVIAVVVVHVSKGKKIKSGYTPQQYTTPPIYQQLPPPPAYAVQQYPQQQMGQQATPQPSPSMSPSLTVPPKDVTERLSKLAELRDKNLITENEFQVKKEELLRDL